MSEQIEEKLNNIYNFLLFEVNAKINIKGLEIFNIMFEIDDEEIKLKFEYDKKYTFDFNMLCLQKLIDKEILKFYHSFE